MKTSKKNGVEEEDGASAGDVPQHPVEGPTEEITPETTRPSRQDPHREASVEKPKNRGTVRKPSSNLP